MYDFIGDIHGHADELEALLNKLGYEKKDGAYSHSTRKAFFLGDFIDRGPKIKETLEIVKPMIEKGHAKCVMANHEFNMICFHTTGENGDWLRKRTPKNKQQISKTLEQLTTNELKAYIEWFKTLPLWHEEENFRVAHACWHQESIDLLQNVLGGNTLDMELIKKRYANSSDPVYSAIELILKGPESKLKNMTFEDSDGHTRDSARIAWWSEDLLVSTPYLQGKIPRDQIDYSFHKESDKLVFFGHYWMPGNKPFVTAPTAQCLDFSVAKNGSLVCYRYDGEQKVDESKFVYVETLCISHSK